MSIKQKKLSFLTILVLTTLLSCALCFGIVGASGRAERGGYSNAAASGGKSENNENAVTTQGNASSKGAERGEYSSAMTFEGKLEDNISAVDTQEQPIDTDESKEEPKSMMWFIVALSVLNGILLVVNCIMIKRVKSVDKNKKRKNTKMYSTLIPMMMLGAFVPGQLAAVIVLAIIAGLQVLELSILVSMKSYKDNHVA